MPKYIIAVREVWVQQKAVEARTLEEALEKAASGKCEAIADAFEYSHDLDRSTWTTEQVAEKPKK